MAAATLKWTGATDGDYAKASNWTSLTGGESDRVPLTGDSVVLPPESTRAIDTTLDQSAVLLVAFTKQPGCNISIGGSAAPLQIDSDSVSLAGSGTVYLNIDNPTSAVTITGAGVSNGAGQYGTHLSGTMTGQDIVINLTASQSVGIAALAGTTAACANVRVAGNGTVTLGAGLTLATGLEVSGSPTVSTYCAITTLNRYEGTLYVMAGAVTTLNAYGNGRVYYNSSATLTMGNISGSAVLDFSGDMRAKTVTTLNLYHANGLNDPNGVVTYTNGVNFNRCAPSGLPVNKKITLGAIT